MLGVNVGELIFKILLRCGFEGAYESEVGIDFLEFAKQFGLDLYDATDFSLRFSRMVNELSRECEKFIDTFADSDDEKTILIYAVETTLSNFAISKSDFISLGRNANALEKKLIAAGEGCLEGVSDREKSYYYRIISFIAKIMLDNFVSLKEFENERKEYVLDRIELMSKRQMELIKTVNAINEKVDTNEPRKYQRFESEYLNCVASTFGEIHLFGADNLDNKMKTYSLSTAYVQLQVRGRDKENEPEEIDLSDIFVNRNDVWISGEAGSGKTTCLYWLAYNLAKGYGINQIDSQTVPVVIELRTYKQEKKIRLTLPNCIKKVMPNSSYTIPEGWIEEKLEKGKLLFLIDGFDEISKEDRQLAYEWINEVDKEGKCHKAFTSRPQIKDRPDIKDISEVNLCAMNQSRIKEFLAYWHKAVLVEKMQRSETDAAAICKHLLSILEKNDSLRKLASNPLLCAMICSLNYNTEMAIPKNKRDLYEACCHMLIDSRNTTRDIADIGLTYEVKKIILAKLALYMMINNQWLVVDKERIKKSMETTIKDMHINGCTAEELLEYLLVRSGLIREPEYGKVSFIHKSFQEYLCAFAISRQADWGYLQSKIGDSNWNEIISIAMGFAKKDIVDEFLQDTINKGVGGDLKYTFYAIEYMNGAVEYSEAIAEVLNNKLRALIPPDELSYSDIQRAGNVAVPFLKYNSKYNQKERLACISVLKNIGTSEALKEAVLYLETSESYQEFEIVIDLISMFSESILKDYDIPDKICSALIKLSMECGALNIPGELIRVLNMMSLNDIDRICALEIPNMHISRFLGGKNDMFYYLATSVKKKETKKDHILTKLAENVDRLTISGELYNSDILLCFNHLKELRIWDYTGIDLIHALNKYTNIYPIEKCIIYTGYADSSYIYFSKLRFLENCKELAIIIPSERPFLIFDNEKVIKKLRKLTILSKGAWKYDYRPFSSLDELCVYGPVVSDEKKRKKTEGCNTKIKVVELAQDNMNSFSKEVFCL